MSTTDPFTNHPNDDAVAAVSADENATESAAERPEQNRSALDEVEHPFDQTNGIVEDVDRREGVAHNNDEQLDADPDADRTEESDEPGRESPEDRRPLVNTTLIAEEIFGDDEKEKPRFD